MTSLKNVTTSAPGQDLLRVRSYVSGAWVDPAGCARDIHCAISGEKIAIAGNADIDVQSALQYARDNGGMALRQMTFHDRARSLKALASYLTEHKELLYELSFHTGATRADAAIDIDGGIGTLFYFASAGRRELPDQQVLLDGNVEQLSRNGSFLGQHIYTPKQGVALHINAFNFPVWGMLEKLAPTLLAGVPAIVKPATVTSYVTQACFQLMLDSGAFPAGSFQFVTDVPTHFLDSLGSQDHISFTGSAKTAQKLRSRPSILQRAVPFMAEQDSLNASLVGPDVTPGSPEFDLFVTEVCREMTTKAGQKCTAIRRIMVPQPLLGDYSEAIVERLKKVTIGDPRDEATHMGALVSAGQKRDVLNVADQLATEAQLLCGGAEPVLPGLKDPGTFIQAMLFQCQQPTTASHVHALEAFGPVATIMPYDNLAQGCELMNRAGGSLVASVITCDSDVARDVTLATAATHGRLYFNNRDSMAEASGHGSPLPHMVHGGPGRAGGSEELGGVRAVKHYMQRTAVQGSPQLLSAIGASHVNGANEMLIDRHPFRLRFDELEVGDTLRTPSRQISLQDIEQFAHFTGDTFYAHMDEEAAAANPFFPGRVAHGYLLLSFAAGLFVDPDPGPVLANTGLNNLTFQKPVSPGDSIRVVLTVKRKTRRNENYGEVAWAVRLYNQTDEQVASYELLTMNAS